MATNLITTASVRCCSAKIQGWGVTIWSTFTVLTDVANWKITIVSGFKRGKQPFSWQFSIAM
jgi:hypothetical protein